MYSNGSLNAFMLLCISIEVYISATQARHATVMCS
jgi:hypothetical protein